MLNDDWKYDKPRKEYYFNDNDLKEHDSNLLDKVADRIKAKINAIFDEPNYQHDGETWQNGLVMSSDIVDEIIAEMKSEIEE